MNVPFAGSALCGKRVVAQSEEMLPAPYSRSLVRVQAGQAFSRSGVGELVSDLSEKR